MKSADPGNSTNSQTAQFYWPVFDTLTWIDRNGKLHPSLAKSWKAVDDKTWEFTLQDGITFQDGSSLEAADVVGTYQHYKDPNSKLPAATTLTTVDTMEAVDASTVRFHLKVPDPTFPKLMSMAFVMPWRNVQKIGLDAFLKAPIGTGAYKWTTIDFNNVFQWQAMPASYVTPRGSAAAQQLEMRFIADPTTKVAALKTGEIDVANPVAISAVEALKSAGLPVVPAEGTAIVVFTLNTFMGPTTDYRVRQAINYAVDKETILKELLQGYGAVTGQIVGKSVLGYNPAIQPYPYDPAKAKQLLADAGFAKGLDLPMITIAGSIMPQSVSEAIVSYLGKVGINVKMNVAEVAVWIGDFLSPPEKRQGMIYAPVNWDPTYEANSVWRWYSATDVPSNRGGMWADPKFDQMYQTAKKEPDETKRGQLYQQAGQYFHDQVPCLMLWQQNSPVGTQKNIKYQAGAYPDMFTAALSKSV